MKYIFTVHSPITLFCSECVVLDKKLEKKDVIFYFTGASPISSLGFCMPSYQQKYRNKWQKIKDYNLVKATDSYINECCGGNDFIAYVDLLHYNQKILVTHPLCKGFNFIEEGTASYIKPNNLNELTRIEKTTFRNQGNREYLRNIIRVLRGYNLKLLALPYFANAFSHVKSVNYYSFHEDAFPGVSSENHIVLNPTSLLDKLSSSWNTQYISDSLILIEESFFSKRNFTINQVRHVYNQTLSCLENEVRTRRILIKLRPKQLVHDSIWSKELDVLGLPYTILDIDHPLETLLLKNKNCLLVGTISSLLFYGSIFGHESISNFELIADRPPSVYDYAGFFWDKVNRI